MPRLQHLLCTAALACYFVLLYYTAVVFPGVGMQAASVNIYCIHVLLFFERRVGFQHPCERFAGLVTNIGYLVDL